MIECVRPNLGHRRGNQDTGYLKLSHKSRVVNYCNGFPFDRGRNPYYRISSYIRKDGASFLASVCKILFWICVRFQRQTGDGCSTPGRCVSLVVVALSSNSDIRESSVSTTHYSWPRIAFKIDRGQIPAFFERIVLDTRDAAGNGDTG